MSAVSVLCQQMRQKCSCCEAAGGAYSAAPAASGASSSMMFRSVRPKRRARAFHALAASASVAPEPEPDPVETQRAEEDSMIAEVDHDEDAAPRRDPEEVALELLQTELGARRIDG